MRSFKHALLLVLAGLLCVLPVLAGGGQDGNGGAGIWVLPRSGNLASPLPVILSAPRSTMHLTALTQPVVMKVSAEVINPAAILIDPTSGANLPMLTSGNIVTIPETTLLGLLRSGVLVADGSIVDAANHGYYFRVTIDPVNQTGDVQVF